MYMSLPLKNLLNIVGNTFKLNRLAKISITNVRHRFISSGKTTVSLLPDP